MGERLAFTFALTGRREWGHGTQGVALGSGLVGLSARAGPQTRLFPHNLHQLNISILNTLRAGPPQSSPPSLCEQSELQCCAPFYAPHEIRCYVVPYKKADQSPLGGRSAFMSVVVWTISPLQ